MIPRPDGFSETSQAFFRKNPTHGAPTGALRRRDPSSSAQWASCGKDYGSWARQEQQLESSHISDLMLARNFAKFGATVNVMARAASEPRLAPAGDALSALETSRRRTESEANGPLSSVSAMSPTARAMPRSGMHAMTGLGEPSPEKAFPGAPGASRGMRSGVQAMWSFERNPALMHPHLERDRGRMGRGVAGPPPRHVHRSFADDDWERMPSRGGGEPAPAPARENLAQRSLGDTALRRSTSGLQGVIGMTWDGAAVAAGGKIRGSDGKYLGH